MHFRLSKFAGAQLVHQNPNIVDLSDKHRPTKLAEIFSELYDNEWTDAFEVFEAKCNSQTDNDKEAHEGVDMLLKLLKVIALLDFNIEKYALSRNVNSFTYITYEIV